MWKSNKTLRWLQYIRKVLVTSNATSQARFYHFFKEVFHISRSYVISVIVGKNIQLYKQSPIRIRMFSSIMAEIMLLNEALKTSITHHPLVKQHIKEETGISSIWVCSWNSNDTVFFNTYWKRQCRWNSKKTCTM